MIEHLISALGLYNRSEIFTKSGEQKWVYYLSPLIVYISHAGIVRKNNTERSIKQEYTYEKTPDTPDACRYRPGSTCLM